MLIFFMKDIQKIEVEIERMNLQKLSHTVEHFQDKPSQLETLEIGTCDSPRIPPTRKAVKSVTKFMTIEA